MADDKMHLSPDEKIEGTKGTVLLVEDEESAVLLLGRALAQEGYAVLTAGDGKEGLRLSLVKHPDVIIADLLLPKMSGIEMIAEIRKNDWGKNAEIIILTNVSDVKTMEEAMSHDTFFYMVKGDSSMADIITKVNSRMKAGKAVAKAPK